MDDIMETITKPWRDPVDYLTLAFWFLIFLIVAFAMLDGMRIAASILAKTAKAAN